MVKRDPGSVDNDFFKKIFFCFLFVNNLCLHEQCARQTDTKAIDVLVFFPLFTHSTGGFNPLYCCDDVEMFFFAERDFFTLFDVKIVFKHVALPGTRKAQPCVIVQRCCLIADAAKIEKDNILMGKHCKKWRHVFSWNAKPARHDEQRVAASIKVSAFYFFVVLRFAGDEFSLQAMSIG